MQLPLRHACLACGRACHGVNVRLVSEAEVTAVTAAAQQLGVTDPIEDGRLRRVDGHCVFLTDDRLCGIHKHVGPHAKPVVCAQYPLVAVDTESGRRHGIDPGCYTAWRTWRDGPVVDPTGAVAHVQRLDPAVGHTERAIVELTRHPGMGLAGLVSALAGGSTGASTIDPAFGQRWLSRVQGADLGTLVAREEAGRPVAHELAPLIAHLEGLSAPPPWSPLPEAQRAWALEVTRRMVWLRLASSLPVPPAVALLTAAGAMSLRWHGVDDDGFGRGMAAWTRALRAPLFWGALIPDPAALRALALGS